jgi:DNA repair exonuclease SbcCD ATPase subunit
MKLNLTNVQQFKSKEYLFPEKGLVLVEGDNSTGKSTILRAITALYSYNESAPNHLKREEKLLGLIPDDPLKSQGIISINSDHCKISLERNGISQSADIYKDKIGSYKGDSKFIITNILTDVSWITRFLNKTLDTEEGQGMALKYIKELSYRLDSFQNIIEGTEQVKDELTRKHHELTNRIEESIKLIKEKEKLQADLIKINDSISSISDELKEISKEQNKKENLEIANRSNALEDKIKSLSNKISNTKEEQLSLENRINDLTRTIRIRRNSLTQYEESLSNVEVRSPEELNDIEEKIELLRDKRASILANFDLVTQARGMIETHKEREITCPLCEKGMLNLVRLGTLSDKFSRERNEVETEIRKLNGERDQGKRSKEEKDQLESNIKKLSNEIKGAEQELTGRTQELEELKSKIEQTFKTLSDYEDQKLELQKILLSGRPDLQKNLEYLAHQKKEVTGKINELDQVTKSRVDVFGIPFAMNSESLKELNRLFIEPVKELSDEVRKLREEEQKKLSVIFNNNIEGVIKALNFPLRIQMDANDGRFNIIVHRKGDSGWVELETKSISASERASIAIAVLLAMAESYGTEPVVLIDAIYEVFDEDRKQDILKYLHNFATKNNKLIVMTVTKSGKKEPEVISYESL